MKNITIIRHAQSESNAGLITYSNELVPLTELGINQARDLACHIPPHDLIIHSPYKRTIQTMGHSILQDLDPEVWYIQEYSYLCSSKYKNTSSEMRFYPKTTYWELADPHYCDGRDAESFAQFMHRIHDFRVKAIQIPESNLLVFGHGLFMKALMWQIITGKYSNWTSVDMNKVNSFFKAISIPNTVMLSIQLENNFLEWKFCLKQNHIQDVTY